MDIKKNETTSEPSLGKTGQNKERLIPIDEFAQEMGVNRSTVDRYAKAGRIETKEKQGQVYVVDKPLAEKDWFEFGIFHAQAKAKTRWQIACLIFASLFVLTVLAGSVGGVRLWTERAGSIEMLTPTQAQLTDAGRLLTALQTQVADASKQIASLQDQLKAEHLDHTTKLEAQQVEHAARIDVFAKAETQLKQAAEQLKALQAQLASERQDYKAQFKAQQVSHAATVDRLHAAISKLSSHIVELSKAVTAVQPAP